MHIPCKESGICPRVVTPLYTDFPIESDLLSRNSYLVPETSPIVDTARSEKKLICYRTLFSRWWLQNHKNLSRGAKIRYITSTSIYIYWEYHSGTHRTYTYLEYLPHIIPPAKKNTRIQFIHKRAKKILRVRL